MLEVQQHQSEVAFVRLSSFLERVFIRLSISRWLCSVSLRRCVIGLSIVLYFSSKSCSNKKYYHPLPQRLLTFLRIFYQFPFMCLFWNNDLTNLADRVLIELAFRGFLFFFRILQLIRTYCQLLVVESITNKFEQLSNLRRNPVTNKSRKLAQVKTTNFET